MKNARIFLLLAGLALAGRAAAQFTDPQDGSLDMSEWLIDYKGFLPVPLIITEPAIGYGGGLGMLFVRNSIRERAEEQKASGETGHLTPPDVFGGAAAATENGTKFGAVGGMFTFDEDRWRYRGGIAKMAVNLDFYGVGGSSDNGDRKIGFALDGWAMSQQLLRRIGGTNNYVALRWVYLDLTASFDPSRPRPIVPSSTGARSSGIGPSLEYDTRDNIFTPSRGMIAALDALFYAPEFGGNDRFQTYRAHVFDYVPLAEPLVLGVRLDGRAARGDTPFYQLPFIDLRGVPKGRYLDDNIAVAETELRWNATPRWAFVGFIGAGRGWGAKKSFSDASTIGAGGAGVRYLMARRLGLYAGADVARGPEDTAFYIQVGSAWR